MILIDDDGTMHAIYSKNVDTILNKIKSEVIGCAYDEPEGYVCLDRKPDRIVELSDVLSIIDKYKTNPNNAAISKTSDVVHKYKQIEDILKTRYGLPISETLDKIIEVTENE